LFAHQGAVVEHMRQKHGFGDGPRYKCDTCDAQFMSRSDLTAHTNKHTQTFQFSCGICAKQFTSPKAYSRHCKKCQGADRVHVCRQCGKAFHRKDHLTQHEQTHAEKSIRCDQCGRMFKHTPSLKRHVSRWHGRPFCMAFLILRLLFLSSLFTN
jgi:uncharacterized Zn-finger protein